MYLIDFSGALKVSFSQTKPNVPDKKEAIKMAIFEKVIISSPSFLKASRVMNIDIVKPIPPSIPAPKIFLHLRSFGNLQIPKVTAKYEKNQIPKGFPKTKPKIIPIEFSCDNPSCQSELMAMQVLATANKGRMIKATGL